jgi:hypothetical protein
MRRTILIPTGLAALSALMLGGCSMFENLGGAKKVSPDEFKIVSHSPLTMPPNAELRPPRPGEPRPQEVTPADQAKEAAQGHGRTSAEASLVQKGGGGNVDPNIRSRVNTDTKTINDSDKTFIDSLIFWQNTPPPGVVVDPTKEQQRIRDAQAAGQPASGQTATIKRRQRGLLEGLF